MKLSGIPRSLRSVTAGLILVSLAGPSFVLAVPGNKGRSAEITVSGTGENGAKPAVGLNGEPVVSGRTFFSPSTLETPKKVSADINLPGLGRVSMSPGTMLSIGFDENSITGRLHAGRIRVFSSKGTTVNIETPDERVANDPLVPGTFTLDLTAGLTQAVAESGSITLGSGRSPAQAQTPPASQSILVPTAIFAGLVGTAVLLVLFNRVDDDDRAADVVVSPIR